MTGETTVILLVAGGRGLRAGGGTPKQYRLLGGRPVIARTMEALLAVDADVLIKPVIHPDDAGLFAEALELLGEDAAGKVLAPVAGGASRCDSVRAGVAAVASNPLGTRVLVHDAARPFVSRDLLDRALRIMKGPAAIPTLPVTDTVKRVDAAGVIAETLDRAGLRLVQTPQSFDLITLFAAHKAAHDAGRHDFTDDGALMEWFGVPVQTFDGDPDNIKLTTSADFDMAERRFRAPALLTCVGTGYDVHAFGPGDHVTLCGIRIPHDQGVLAHSDGDVAYHALCDAIFGALAEGDIGQHFPPSDARWKGAASGVFVRFAAERIRARSGRLDHVDISIVCEAPKVGPYRAAMLARIADDTGLPVSRIGLKATTSERLGFTGRREGMAAFATATVRLPENDDA